MRLFIGINLPKKLRGRIDRTVRPLREEDMPIRWVAPEKLHLTLKFLGEVRDEHVTAAEEAMGRATRSTTAFSTSFGPFGAFPTIRRPRVLWLGIEATPELRCLKQDLEWSLGEVGFETETRAFHPHVTVGRARDDRGAGAFRGLDQRLAELEVAGELRVHTVDLMRSRLGPDGARYSVIASARLAAA